MSELRDFRAACRTWLTDNVPDSLKGSRKGKFTGYWGGRKAAHIEPDVLLWFERCRQRGWTAPTWPREFGGGGLSKDEGDVLESLMEELKIPPPLVGFGLAMIGPTLLDFGTQEQKASHIPAIINGEIRWCQGYSEPAAGSDLASLKCRATRDGDQYLVSGQKVWTSFADQSDWIFALVRTDFDAPKRDGISFLLIDMQTPGVAVRPIDLISGSSPFCEVFLDNVPVPVTNRVGEENQGWTPAKALLQYERSMIGSAIGGQLSSAEDQLIALAREALDAAVGPLPDPLLRSELAAWAIDQRCFDLTLERIRQSLHEGQPPGAESSIAKVAGSELKQRRYELGVRIAGPSGLGWEGPGFDDEVLDLTREWLRSRANSIEGGTSEIQLNIVATRVLGLPRGR